MIVTMVVCLLSFTALAQRLNEVIIGAGHPGSEGICIGEGRNDGITRLYSLAGWSGQSTGFEWTYGGTWDNGQVLYSGLGVAYSPIVSSLNGELTQNRLFLGTYNGQTLHYLTNEGSNWIDSIVPGAYTGKNLCLRASSARNDGVERLYMASGDGPGGLYEFTRNGGSWNVATITIGDFGEFDIGNGRNDGAERIYTGSRSGNSGLVEISWNTNSYVLDTIWQLGSIQTVYVGTGRGDDTNRVYCNEWNGNLYELTYRNNTWERTEVAGSAARYYITSGKLRYDGVKRLYSSLKGIGVREYAWNGTGFAVDAITSASGGIAIGNARNDGKSRMYVAGGESANPGGHVIEVSDNNPPDVDSGSRIAIHNSYEPTSGRLWRRTVLTRNLLIYDIFGRQLHQHFFHTAGRILILTDKEVGSNKKVLIR